MAFSTPTCAQCQLVIAIATAAIVVAYIFGYMAIDMARDMATYYRYTAIVVQVAVVRTVVVFVVVMALVVVVS